jgi:hypothetical protein
MRGLAALPIVAWLALAGCLPPPPPAPASPVAVQADPTAAPLLSSTSAPTAAVAPTALPTVAGGAAAPTASPQSRVPRATPTAAAAPATAAPIPSPVDPAPGGLVMVAHTGGEGVYLRATSGGDARLVAYPEGMLLTVLGPARRVEGRPWLPVRGPDGSIGWVPAEYTTLIEGAPALSSAPPATGPAAPSSRPASSAV